MQRYNAQAAVTETQIVIAAEITIDSPDFGHLEPMVTATETELAAIGSEMPQVVVADAGYWHQVQMDSVIERGIQVLIPTGRRQTQGAHGPAGTAASTPSWGPAKVRPKPAVGGLRWAVELIGRLSQTPGGNGLAPDGSALRDAVVLHPELLWPR